MSSSPRAGALGLLLLTIACSGEVGGNGDPAQAGSGKSGQSGSGPVGPSGGNGASASGGSSGAGQAGSHGPSIPDFTLECDAAKPGRPVLRLLNRREFERTIADVFPELTGDWTNTLPSPEVSALGFDNDAGTTVGGQLAARLLETAESIGAAVTGDELGSLLPCATSAADRACASDFLQKYGRRLFRRPLSESESERYLALFDTALEKSDFKTALKWITAGLVQSPHALYRSEIGEKQADGTRTLTPHEIASELSYTFGGSTPSEDLLGKADSGNLGDTAALAKAMLATDPGKQQFRRFFEAYVGYPRVASINRGSSTGAVEFTDVSNDMVEETRRFIDETLLDKPGGVADLLTSNATSVSSRLATFYDFPSPGGDWTPLRRPAGRGIGILAQGSFLTTHASADTSSPTHRGLFVFTRLLCRKAPRPPDTVPPLAAGQTSTATTRERYELAHAAGSCAGCHKLFDPIGFGFEHFDQVGRYRENENGVPIDSAASISNPDGSTLIEFTGQEDLMTKLAALPEVYQCFSNFLSIYAFGTADSCLGSTQVPALRDGSIGIVDAFARLASEPHFTRRASQ